MTDPILSQAERYKKASDIVMAKLPSWKKLAMDAARKEGRLDSRFLEDYAKEVIEMAREEELSLSA